MHASAHQKCEFITNTCTNGANAREFTTRECQVKLELYRITATKSKETRNKILAQENTGMG